MTITNVWRFLKETFSLKNKEQKLTFNKESDNLWYIDIPWIFDHGNLQMVGGANKLLEFLNPSTVTVSCIPSNNDNFIEGYFRLSRINCGLFKGAFYRVEGLEGFHRDIWICPVTLFVLHKYPKFIHLKQI